MLSEIKIVNPEEDLSQIVKVLNASHLTIAEQFGFTKEDNPSNNAFIDTLTLKEQLCKGITLYAQFVNGQAVGCIAIEKAAKEVDTFYIEKVSVTPEYRHQGLGVELMNFAHNEIKKQGGTKSSVALIDSHPVLKNWYLSQDYEITGTKDFEHLPFAVCFMSKWL